VSTSAFSLFTPGSNGLSLTCDAASGNCSTLADQADNDIPGDPPSPTVGQCAPPHNTYLFSGYGDPSMRAEQLVPDSDGVDLWLLYSYPSYNWSVPSPSCSNTTTVETHLAGSIANSGPNGGASWIAYCGGVACSGPSGPATPIFPSGALLLRDHHAYQRPHVHVPKRLQRRPRRWRAAAVDMVDLLLLP
jgi:hypothetical protein